MGKTERVSHAHQVLPLPRVERKPHVSNDHFSTIAKSKSITALYTPSKPLLDPPMPIWEMLSQVGRLERAADKYTLHKEYQIDQTYNKIQQFQRTEALKLEEAYAASQDVSFWSLLEDIGSCLMSSISFFFGFSALATGGTIVGAALIVSGVLSLSNIAFKHAQAWDWIADQVAGGDKEMRQAIVTYLPVAVGITAAALGAYGAWGAWNTSHLEGTAKGLAILQTTASLAKGITAYGSGRAAAHYKSAGAEFSALQTKTELTTLGLENYIEDIKDFQKKLTNVQELVGRLVQDTNRAVQLTQQTV